MSEVSVTKKMLDTLRSRRTVKEEAAQKEFKFEGVEKDNFLSRSKILMEEAVKDKKKALTEDEDIGTTHSKSLTIKKSTPQFGDIRVSQEEAIRKTINDNVTFSDDALKYYPDADDMTLNGKVQSLNLSFQFRYNEPSGNGCFIWCDATQLTDVNTRAIGKISDAFMNWRDSITQEGDLMDKLKKAYNNHGDE